MDGPHRLGRCFVFPLQKGFMSVEFFWTPCEYSTLTGTLVTSLPPAKAGAGGDTSGENRRSASYPHGRNKFVQQLHNPRVTSGLRLQVLQNFFLPQGVEGRSKFQPFGSGRLADCCGDCWIRVQPQRIRRDFILNRCRATRFGPRPFGVLFKGPTLRQI